VKPVSDRRGQDDRPGAGPAAARFESRPSPSWSPRA